MSITSLFTIWLICGLISFILGMCFATPTLNGKHLKINKDAWKYTILDIKRNSIITLLVTIFAGILLGPILSLYILYHLIKGRNHEGQAPIQEVDDGYKH